METLKCSACKEILPLSRFNKSNKYTRGYKYQCKKCCYKQNQKYAKKKVKNPRSSKLYEGNKKQCTKCKEIKQLSSFYLDKHNRYASYCRDCVTSTARIQRYRNLLGIVPIKKMQKATGFFNELKEDLNNCQGLVYDSDY